jgi:hypothetical protein
MWTLLTPYGLLGTSTQVERDHPTSDGCSLFLVLRIRTVECQQGILDSTPLHHVLPQLHRVLGAWPCPIFEDITCEITDRVCPLCL